MQSNNMKNLFPKSNKKNWVYSLVSIAVFVLVISFLFQEGMKKTVALSLNGEEQLVRTNASTVEDIFAELEIDLQDQDYLYPEGNSDVYHDMKIRWKPAKQVSFNAGGETRQLFTTADNVGEFLRKEKIDVGELDELSHDLDAEIKESMKITLEEAFAWTFVDGTKKHKEWSTSITVADFLKQQDIKLNKDDRITPSEDTVLTEGAKVKIVRVEKVTDVLEEPQDFAIETKKDEDLASGTEEVVQKGKKGLVEKTYEVVKENGKEKSRKLKKEKVVRESVNQIVSVGTKVLVADVSRGAQPDKKAEAAPSSNTVKATKTSAKPAQTTAAKTAAASKADASSSEGKEMYVSSTAYTASCNGCSGITATGINLKANPDLKVIAVDPSVIPLGTKVHVEGYGYAVAGDTGGAIKGNKIDVFVSSQEEALQWGNRQVKIKILQ
ncbi:DUF348 domain-containing protein [Jeotgalibacillus sp. S-D1]|uniref:G5 and 3D domain-containing protein n=1 Tax=Jeotgalibacillus sp. S-D1 TaxID=2552189 RepID=UPI001059C77F|nr:G5 and 3D domain-containing protein [Jeotgalibacillus sp. S-D1]TDL30435.1 DUF348 domain-containing protein [Jeotgalibacillus sp. S-D1]